MNNPELDDDADDKSPPEPYREIFVRMGDDRDDIEITYLDPPAGETTPGVPRDAEQNPPPPTAASEK